MDPGFRQDDEGAGDESAVTPFDYSAISTSLRRKGPGMNGEL
jgi:hypothetical protein